MVIFLLQDFKIESRRINYKKILFFPVLIESAEVEFNQMIEEELQRRIREQEAHEHSERRKASRLRRKNARGSEFGHESDAEENEGSATEDHGYGLENGHENGTTNGHTNGHHENGVNGNGVKT